LPSFAGPVIQPGGPARRKAGGVIAGKYQEPACAGECPDRGWRVLRNSGSGYGGVLCFGEYCGGYGMGSKSLTACQAAGHPAFGRVSGGYRRSTQRPRSVGQGNAQGRMLSPTEPWGGVRITCWEAENPGGQSTPLCGNVAAGRQDAALNGKKRKQGCLRFFLPLCPRPRAGGCPSPFEPLMKGLRPERANPTNVSFERGKPGGEGEGQYGPPLHCRRSTHRMMGRSGPGWV
jgi:hypothetical protein